MKKALRDKKEGGWLLIDLSNSRTKFALATPERLLEKRLLPTASLSAETLEGVVKGWKVSRVIVASVVPKALKKVVAFFKRKKIPLTSIHGALDLGFKICYPNPSSTGADRLANVAGALARYQGPMIVIDFGTAITFDVISVSGNYLGGIIAPGLTTSLEALHRKTALVPLAQPTAIKRALGKNTLASLHSGVILGARGLVKEVVERITCENFSYKVPYVIATGGDAKLVARGTKLFDEVTPELTLEGLRELGKRL